MVFQRGGRRPYRRGVQARVNSQRSRAKKARLGYSGAFKSGRRAGRRVSAASYRRQCLLGTHPEKKFVDSAIAYAPGAGGAVGIGVDIDQGATESNRVGRKATVTDILFKGHIAFGATTGAAPDGVNRVRVLLVQDTQPNGALPTAINIFGAAADINSYRDLPNASRFKILYNKLFTRGPPCAVGDGTTNWNLASYVPVRANIKCCIPFEFSGTGSGIADQTTNSVVWVLFEEASAPATTTQITQRIRFVE